MTKKGDMLYAWTSDADIKKHAELGGAVTALWKYALESKTVDGVLVVTKGADLYDAQPVLITDAKDLVNTAGSLHCGTLLIPKLIKKYLDGAKDIKIGVTVKGCDAMAFYELAKRKQINLDNIYMIGVNCGGSVSAVPARKMIADKFGVDPECRPQGRDRQGPVHHRVRGRPQGHLDRRTRRGRVRPPDQLPALLR